MYGMVEIFLIMMKNENQKTKRFQMFNDKPIIVKNFFHFTYFTFLFSTFYSCYKYMSKSVAEGR